MKSLTTKFIVFIIVPVVLILSALSLTSYMVARNLLIDQIKDSGRNFLSAMAGDISSRIVQVQSALKLLAETENLDAIDDAQRQVLFVALKKHLSGSVTSVFMGFQAGKFIRSKKTPLPTGFDPRKRPWYLDALRLPAGVLYGITAPYLDASTNHPTVTLYKKVLGYNGELVGVLGVDVDVSLASSDMSTDISFLKGGQSILVNKEAVVLLHPDPTKIGFDIGITGEEMDIQISKDIKNPELQHNQYVGQRMGKSWYLGYHQTKNAPLAVVLSVPAKTVLEPLGRLSLQILALNFLMIVGLFILLHIVSRRISKPIIDLKDTAIHVTSTGSYSDPIQVITADEVGQLTSAFNEMMEGLRQRDFIRDTFGRYVTKEVVEELLDTSEGLKLGGEVREVTIMFSDLRGFTPLCEQLSPDTLIAVLNSYLSRMSTIISEYKGTINEFIGDAILTFFGAPVEHGDSPARAVACALAMQLSMAEVNRENQNKGLPPLSMGIGVNTGEVIVGNIGSEERAKYGVVGHHINLASRTEGMTVGGQILITPSTYEQVKEVVIIRAVHPVRFKGVEEKIDIYDVVGMHSPYNLMLPDHTTEPMPLIKPISVTVYRMKGKKTESAGMKAQLTQFSPPRASLQGSAKIDPLNEVRVDFIEPDDGERIYMYAKVASVSQTGGNFMHMLQISYSTPMVYKFIRRFMK